MLLRCVRRSANASSIIAMIRLHGDADQAAKPARNVDLMRAGFPPGGPFGAESSADSASSTSSIVTKRFDPGISRKAGFDATAAASDAQDARIARFSPPDRL